LEARLFECRAIAVRIRNTREPKPSASDKHIVRPTEPNSVPEMMAATPWAMQMRAISAEEPRQLVETLTGAILGCGGWVLSRGANDTGGISMLFEFERQACVEIYSMLIAVGLELSRAGHISFTELCQCTRSHPGDCAREIASVDLEIQTFPLELIHASGSIQTA
jgi:hypothetical protein